MCPRGIAWSKVAPNNTTFVSVALSFGRAGRPLESLDVLETMRQRGSPPDAICCQTVLRVLDRWNKPAEALGLFEYMGHHGLLEVPGAKPRGLASSVAIQLRAWSVTIDHAFSYPIGSHEMRYTAKSCSHASTRC